MRKFITDFFIMTLSLSMLGQSAQAHILFKNQKPTRNQKAMKAVGEESGNNFSLESAKKLGYVATLIKTPKKISKNLVVKIKEFEAKTLVAWKEYARDAEGEYSGRTPEEREWIANNPKEFLKVAHLMEIFEVYKITSKSGRLIGYSVQLTNHMQSTIYQDGAWFVLYADEGFRVVDVYEGAA
jgi:hypothetical protein